VPDNHVEHLFGKADLAGRKAAPAILALEHAPRTIRYYKTLLRYGLWPQARRRGPTVGAAPRRLSQP